MSYSLLGLTELRRERGAVVACGTMEQAARICLWSRVASRVLLPLFDVESTSTDALYDAAVEYPWADVLNPRGTIAVHTTASRNTKIHTQYVSLKLKDAVVDHCRDHHGVRPSVSMWIALMCRYRCMPHWRGFRSALICLAIVCTSAVIALP
jgi:23S rRNA (guanine2445-N2)-methyltransferase / 23S rRNA (guanine2069-N7)-methyltransferase